MRFFTKTSFILLILLAVAPLTHAQAQIEQSVPIVSAQKQDTAEINQSLPPEPDAEVTILRDEYAGKYNLATLVPLSKLYWRLGAFDLEDDEAITNYLKINECKLFAEYVHDDLEWKEIIGTMRKHIADTRNAFPLNFQFVLQMHLGRYDPVLGGFPIVDKTGFKDAKRIEVNSMDKSADICFDNNPIKDYPKSMIILLSKPFTLDFLKLDEHVAQAYILRKKSEFSELPDDARIRRYERDAYLRLRVTFSQYHGNLRGTGGEPRAILFGNIDGFEIFEDSEQKRLMLSVTNKPDPAMSVPSTPKTGNAPIPPDTRPINSKTIEVAPAPGYGATP